MHSAIDRYPSRVGGSEQIVDRTDPVLYPTPDTPAVLSREQLARYQRDGFLVIPDFMPEAVAPLLAETDRLKQHLAGDETLVLEPDSEELRTVFKPFAHSRLIERFLRQPFIVNAARQILGSEVYMMQSRINVKPAFRGRAFAWHSDFETWHVEDGMPGMRALTAWLMLSENHEHNGPLYVIPGSHHHYVSCAGRTGRDNYKSSLRKQTLGVPSPDSLDRLMSGRGVTSITGAPGTLVFHECNLMHGSPDNISPDPRSILMCVYNSVENRPVRPFGGQAPRPDYLSNRDCSPVKPSAGEAEREGRAGSRSRRRREVSLH